MGNEIKIYCAEHQATFDLEVAPVLKCEIRPHSLSIGFPNSEFWSYCCDCQIFSPCDFETGGKAASSCLHCGRGTVFHYLCSNCKTVVYDSMTDTRGKILSTDSVRGIRGPCPSCECQSPKKLTFHNCESAGTGIVTGRKTCPFCLCPTAAARTGASFSKNQVEQQSPGLCCPVCGAPRDVDAALCVDCGLGSDFAPTITETPNAGAPPPTSQQWLFCTNCGTENKVGSNTCVACGKSLNHAPKPASPLISGGHQSRYIAAFIAIPLVFFVFIAIVVSLLSSLKSGTPANNANVQVQKAPSLSSTPNKSNNDARIGKRGVLSVDVNLRRYANKDAEWLGTHYRGAKIEILDVDSSGPQDWYKIKVLSYGTSVTTGRAGKDQNSEDVGWVNSYPISSDGRNRTSLVVFE